MAETLPLTFVTTCKPFEGLDGILQRNAIGSWRALGIEVLILGDEPGVATVCAQLGCHHISQVERGPKNLPYISSIFAIAESEVRTEFYAYLNSDIVLGQGSGQGLRQAVDQIPEACNVLLTGRRRNIPLLSPLEFSEGGWTKDLEYLDQEYGTWDHDYAIDFFLVNKGWLGPLPDLLVGRAGWDNWMLHHASSRGAMIVDGSETIRLYHPLHGYRLLGKTALDNRQNDESFENLDRIGGDRSSIEKARTHKATQAGISKVLQDEQSGFQVDLEKLFRADLKAMEYQTFEGPDQLVNHLCVVLARSLSFMPVCLDCDRGEVDLLDLRSKLRALVEQDKTAGAIQCLQDFLLCDFLENLQGVSRDIYVWGAGTAGRRLASLLNRHGTLIESFVDSKPKAASIVMEGCRYKCISLQQFLSQAPNNAFVVLASMHYRDMAQVLLERELKASVDFTF